MISLNDEYTYSPIYYRNIANILPAANYEPNSLLLCDFRPKTNTVFLFSSVVWLVQTICIVLHAQSSIGPNASATAADGFRLSWGLFQLFHHSFTALPCRPNHDKNIKNMCFKGGRLAHEFRTCVNMPTTPFLNTKIVIHVAVGQVLRRKLSDDHHSTLRDSYHQGIMEEANGCISPGQVCNSLGAATNEFRNCIQMVVSLKNVCFGRQFLCEKGVPHQHHQNVKASQILSDTQY